MLLCSPRQPQKEAGNVKHCVLGLVAFACAVLPTPTGLVPGERRPSAGANLSFFPALLACWMRLGFEKASNQESKDEPHMQKQSAHEPCTPLSKVARK